MRQERQDLEVFAQIESRIPPQNVDAEEAILGGVLLDPEALSRITSLIVPEAFYLNAHQEIFRAMLALQSLGLPADLMGVSTWLRDRDILKRVGGQNKLIQLIDHTVSAVNIDQYALLVMEKFTRRKLIQAAGEVAQLGYDTSQSIGEVLDSSEQKIFAATQSGGKNDLVAISDVTLSTYTDIEERSLGLKLPGVPSGFRDLDAITQGLQRSDLIIVAGRPSMGKTAIGLNIVQNVAEISRLPIAIFSLEMSKEQLVQRLLSGKSRIESGRLRAGRVSKGEWEVLGHAIAGVAPLPIYIDDTAGLTVSELRSKARRLQAECGGALGLIMIDYLQLMEGSGNDRNQELAIITRSLKGLARELNVPVIALSQLSRAVESRTNKRPMMSDLRESGCIEQDSDLIMMLYRDEYYNPDTPDRGIAEVIITKHRNGPTGTVKLLFDSQFTQFLNIGRPELGYRYTED